MAGALSQASGIGDRNGQANASMGIIGEFGSPLQVNGGLSG